MERIVSGIAACAALSLVLIAAPATAANDHNHHGPAATAPAQTEGTVKKIDKARGTVVLAHGPIVNIGMDAMTMAFKVKDPKRLDALKVGDKVRFVADMVGGEIVVTRIEAVK